MEGKGNGNTRNKITNYSDSIAGIKNCRRERGYSAWWDEKRYPRG